MKKKNFQVINNNSKRFNVKFLKKETVPFKNESRYTTQVNFAKRFDQRLASCDIIPDPNYTF